MKYNLIDYLKKYDYLVSIQITDYGAVARFPEQHTVGNNNPAMKVQLECDASIDMLTVTGFAEGLPVFQNRHEVPKYVMNSFALFYVVGVCNRIGYKTEVVVFMDKQGNHITEQEFMFHLMGKELSEEEKTKEKNLIQMINAARPSGWAKEYQAHAESLGIGVGLHLIRTALGEQDEETQSFVVG